MKLPEKMAESSGTKWWIHCSRKFLVEIKKMCLLLETKGNFGTIATIFPIHGKILKIKLLDLN